MRDFEIKRKFENLFCSSFIQLDIKKCTDGIRTSDSQQELLRIRYTHKLCACYRHHSMFATESSPPRVQTRDFTLKSVHPTSGSNH